MKLISRLRERCYCAYCKAERTVYVKKHVDLTNVVATILLSMATAFAYFGVPDPRGLVLFCVFILGAEIFIYSRWRASMTCKLCGFDPLVYKRSPSAAAQGVREFFQKNSHDPRFHLTRSPLLERHRQNLKRERRAADIRFMQEKVAGKLPPVPTKSV